MRQPACVAREELRDLPVFDGEHIGAARRENVDRFVAPAAAGVVKLDTRSSASSPATGISQRSRSQARQIRRSKPSCSAEIVGPAVDRGA